MLLSISPHTHTHTHVHGHAHAHAYTHMCTQHTHTALPEPIRALRQEQALYKNRKRALGKGGARELQVYLEITTCVLDTHFQCLQWYGGRGALLQLTTNSAVYGHYASGQFTIGQNLNVWGSSRKILILNYLSQRDGSIVTFYCRITITSLVTDWPKVTSYILCENLNIYGIYNLFLTAIPFGLWSSDVVTFTNNKYML